jgi:hypothetical protein
VTLPPYYIPKGTSGEPYAELEDYLDKDDFSNLLGVLGQFAGKTVSFGESILNQFVFKGKNPEAQSEEEENEEYVVPGQKSDVAGQPKINLKQKL